MSDARGVFVRGAEFETMCFNLVDLPPPSIVRVFDLFLKHPGDRGDQSPGSSLSAEGWAPLQVYSNYLMNILSGGYTVQ